MVGPGPRGARQDLSRGTCSSKTLTCCSLCLFCLANFYSTFKLLPPLWWLPFLLPTAKHPPFKAIRLPRHKLWPCLFLAIWFWESCFSFQCLICKMRWIIVFTYRVVGEIQWGTMCRDLQQWLAYSKCSINVSSVSWSLPLCRYRTGIGNEWMDMGQD